MAVLYVPDAQSAHGPPSGPVEPALQVQLLMVVAPPSEPEFIAQIEHAAEPATDLNLPATHSAHVPLWAQ